MAALAADVNGSLVGNYRSAQFVANAADTYFRGSIVYADTLGGCQVTAATNDRVLGYSPRNQVVAAGDLVEVVTSGQVWLPVGTGITASDEGEILVNDGPVDSDNPADMKAAGDITLAAADAAIGRIKRVTATQMLVELGNLTGGIYDATAAAWV